MSSPILLQTLPLSDWLRLGRLFDSTGDQEIRIMFLQRRVFA